MIIYLSQFLLNPLSLISHFGSACSNETGVACNTGLPTPGNNGNVDGSQLNSLLGIAFGILAALSVLFIVMAAFRMVTAQGDSQQVSKARSTIVYALIGLIVALLAEAFVAFVLDKLT